MMAGPKNQGGGDAKAKQKSELKGIDPVKFGQFAKAQAEEKWVNTPSAKILDALRARAEAEGVTADHEGRFELVQKFKFGDDAAVLVKHLENPLDPDDDTAGLWVRKRDMQKPWWRNVLEAAGYPLAKLHVIEPTIFESLDGVDRMKAADFKVSKIAATLGVDSGRVDEIENALASALTPIVQTHFHVEYGDGGGDLTDRWRLVPKDQATAESCLNITDPYKATMMRVFSNKIDIMAQIGKNLTK